jgi:hypothetical protein
MNNKEKIAAALHLSNDKTKNIETLSEAVENFFKDLHIEMEDWKLSMEEARDGTHIFIRFQIHVKNEGVFD